MKGLAKLSVLVAIVFLFTSCVTTQVTNTKKESANDVEMFFSKKPSGEYEEIMFIQADGSVFHSSKTLIKKLKQRAKQEGCDAVIDIRFDYQFWWPNVSGIAIKYK
jgi:uncharacterized protein YbjQ (UPF0145 family)